MTYLKDIATIDKNEHKQQEEEDEEELEVEEEEEPEEEEEEEEEEEKEEPEEEEEEEDEAEAEEPIEEHPHQTKIELISVDMVRFIIIAIWMILYQTITTFTVTGISTIVVASVKCFGAIVGLTVIVVPVTYAISPKCVCGFKFRSLAPIIADGLYKLDYFVNYFVNRVARAIGDKLKRS